VALMGCRHYCIVVQARALEDLKEKGSAPALMGATTVKEKGSAPALVGATPAMSPTRCKKAPACILLQSRALSGLAAAGCAAGQC
jgi:hypothetical protein